MLSWLHWSKFLRRGALRFAVLLCWTIFNATLFDPFHVFSFFFINPCRFGKTRKHLWVSLDPLKLKLTFLNIGKTKSKQVILQNKLNEQSIRSGFSILLRFGKRYYRFAVFSEVFCDMQYLCFFLQHCGVQNSPNVPLSKIFRSFGGGKSSTFNSQVMIPYPKFGGVTLCSGFYNIFQV